MVWAFSPSSPRYGASIGTSSFSRLLSINTSRWGSLANLILNKKTQLEGYWGVAKYLYLELYTGPHMHQPGAARDWCQNGFPPAQAAVWSTSWGNSYQALQGAPQHVLGPPSQVVQLGVSLVMWYVCWSAMAQMYIILKMPLHWNTCQAFLFDKEFLLPTSIMITLFTFLAFIRMKGVSDLSERPGFFRQIVDAAPKEIAKVSAQSWSITHGQWCLLSWAWGEIECFVLHTNDEKVMELCRWAGLKTACAHPHAGLCFCRGSVQPAFRGAEKVSGLAGAWHCGPRRIRWCKSHWGELLSRLL